MTNRISYKKRTLKGRPCTRLSGTQGAEFIQAFKISLIYILLCSRPALAPLSSQQPVRVWPLALAGRVTPSRHTPHTTAVSTVPPRTPRRARRTGIGGGVWRGHSLSHCFAYGLSAQFTVALHESRPHGLHGSANVRCRASQRVREWLSLCLAGTPTRPTDRS